MVVLAVDVGRDRAAEGDERVPGTTGGKNPRGRNYR